MYEYKIACVYVCKRVTQTFCMCNSLLPYEHNQLDLSIQFAIPIIAVRIHKFHELLLIESFCDYIKLNCGPKDEWITCTFDSHNARTMHCTLLT